MAAHDLKPHDIIVFHGKDAWKVAGVHLGAEGHESLIVLRSHTLLPIRAGGAPIIEMTVPEPFLRCALDSDAMTILRAARP